VLVKWFIGVAIFVSAVASVKEFNKLFFTHRNKNNNCWLLCIVL